MIQRMAINLLSGYAGKAARVLCGLGLVTLLVWRLGAEGFGLVVLMESLVAIGEALGDCVRSGTARYSAFTLAKGAREEMAGYLQAASRIVLGLAVVLTGAGLILGFLIPKIYQIPEQWAFATVVMFILLALGAIISLPSVMPWSALYARHRYDVLNIVQSSADIFKLVLVAVIFSAAGGRFASLESYGCIFVVMSAYKCAATYYCSIKMYPDRPPAGISTDSKKIKEILSFGGFVSLEHATGMVYDHALQIIINLIWGPLYNSLYAVSRKFPTALENLFLEPLWTLTPAVTEMAAHDRHDRLRRLLLSATRITAIVSLPALTGLSLFAGPIIRLWVGEEFALSAFLVPFHVIPLVLTLPAAVCHSLPNAFAKVRLPSLVMNVILAAGLGGVFFLAKNTQTGLAGAAAVEAAAHAAFYAAFLPWYACRLARVPLFRFWLSYIKPLAGAVFFFLPMAMCKSFFIGQDLAKTAYGLGVFTFLSLAYYGTCYFLVLSGEERGLLAKAYRAMPWARNTGPAERTTGLQS